MRKKLWTKKNFQSKRNLQETFRKKKKTTALKKKTF